MREPHSTAPESLRLSVGVLTVLIIIALSSFMAVLIGVQHPPQVTRCDASGKFSDGL